MTMTFPPGFRRMLSRAALSNLLVLLLVSPQALPQAGDSQATIIHNARVAVARGDGYEFEQAVVLRDGRIAGIGSDEEILAERDERTRVIDAGGRTLIPGLVDSHMHAIRAGRFYNLELRWDGVGSLSRALEMISEQAARTPPGQWVRVIGGWSPYQFDEQRMPTPAELTEAAPDTPVFVSFLKSRAFVNRAGAEALGINRFRPAPDGGRYEMADGGGAVLLAEPDPTILFEALEALPELSANDQVNSTRRFYRELSRFGLTSVIDAGGGGHVFPDDYAGTRAVAEAGPMPIRISYYLFPQTADHELLAFRYWSRNFDLDSNDSTTENGYTLEGAGEFLTWEAADYENFAAARPEVLERPHMRQSLYETTRFLARWRCPIRVHATYDESLRRILDVFEQVDREFSFDGLRCTIDHVETIAPETIARVESLSCGIAVQSRMAFAGEFFLDRYGEDATAEAPPLRRLIDSKVPLGLGSDGTIVSTYNPWITLYWAVTGRTVGGTQLYPEDARLSRAEALRLHTEGSAWFSGEASLKGRIELGRYADLALLSADYFSVDAEDIKNIESVLTVVDGRVVHASGEYADLAPPTPDARPSWSPVDHFGG